MKTILIIILWMMTASSSFAQDAFETFRQEMKKLEEKENEYGNVIWGKDKDAFSQAHKDSVLVLCNEVRAAKRKLAQNAIDANRDNKRFVQVLGFYIQNFLTIDELEAELKKFTPAVQKETVWTDKMDFIKYTRLQMPGNPFTDFTVKDHQGKEIRLAEIVKKNKLVMIDFWASWCGACRATMPHLKEIYPEYKKRGVEFFTVSFDDKKEAWEKASKEEALPWVDGSNLQGWKDPISKHYAIPGIPHKVLIGKDGKIVGSGYFQQGALEKAMDEYLSRNK